MLSIVSVGTPMGTTKGASNATVDSPEILNSLVAKDTFNKGVFIGQVYLNLTGNPTKSEVLKNFTKIGKIALSNHRAKGGNPLTPRELKSLRENLLSTGKVGSLML